MPGGSRRTIWEAATGGDLFHKIRQDHSTYLLSSGAPGANQQALVAFHGSLEIDTESASVFRFTYQADNIPKDVVLTTPFIRDYDFEAKWGQRVHCLSGF